MKKILNKVDLAHAKKLAGELVEKFSSRQIVLLQGDLGAGKTQWAQLIVAALQPQNDQQVAFSPTYSVINEYPLANNSVTHVDLYRLESEDEIASVGFWDLFEREQGIIIIEWPERISLVDLPRDWSQLTIKITKSDTQEHRNLEIIS